MRYYAASRVFTAVLAAGCSCFSCVPLDVAAQDMGFFTYVDEGQGGDPTPDQGQIHETDGLIELGVHDWSQSITTGIGGQLSQIEFLIETDFSSATLPATFDLSIFDGGNPPPGSALYSEQLVIQEEHLDEGVFTWEVGGGNLSFENGDVFTFGLTAKQPGFVISGNASPGYEGGELYQNGLLAGSVTTWDHDESGGWHAPFWDEGVPNSNEKIAVLGTVIGSSTRVVFIDEPVTVNGIRFENSRGSYIIAGVPGVTLEASSDGVLPSVHSTGGTHTFQAPVALIDDAHAEADGGNLVFDNQVELNGNTLTLSGNVALNHSVVDSIGGGSVSGSGSLATEGATSIGANLTLDGALLDFDLRDDGGATPDRFDVLGLATLIGDIEVVVDLVAGFTPTAPIPVLTTTDGIIQGELTSLALTGSGADAFTGLGVVGSDLVLLTDGSSGDFNDDGLVDGVDFLKWQRGESNVVLSPEDLADWETNFGTTSAPPATTAVPEPATIAILVVGLAALSAQRRSR